MCQNLWEPTRGLQLLWKRCELRFISGYLFKSEHLPIPLPMILLALDTPQCLVDMPRPMLSTKLFAQSRLRDLPPSDNRLERHDEAHQRIWIVCCAPVE